MILLLLFFAGWSFSDRPKHPVRFRATYTRTAGVRHLLATYDPATGRKGLPPLPKERAGK